MAIKTKKPAVDLTDLAIGIVVLGIVVTIGATILLNVRDTSLANSALDSNIAYVTPTVEAARPLGNTEPYASLTSVVNGSNGVVVNSGNYSITTDSFGAASIQMTDAQFNYTDLNVTYNTYDTSGNSAWTVADEAASGIAEYGNWFDIIVIVGVAAVILSLIFMAFGQAKGQGSSVSY